MRRGVGRKTIFLIAFILLPIRGFLFALTDSLVGGVGIQLLDGVAAGIRRQFDHRSGRPDVRHWVLQPCARACRPSQLAYARREAICFRVLWFRLSLHHRFLTLAAIAGSGVIFFALFMPESQTGGGNWYENVTLTAPAPAHGLSHMHVI